MDDSTFDQIPIEPTPEELLVYALPKNVAQDAVDSFAGAHHKLNVAEPNDTN